MGYERIQKPEGLLYHYTRKENLESILRDGRIRKFCDRETWFTKSLADTLRLMSLTVMQEGAAYYDARGRLQRNRWKRYSMPTLLARQRTRQNWVMMLPAT